MSASFRTLQFSRCHPHLRRSGIGIMLGSPSTINARSHFAIKGKSTRALPIPRLNVDPVFSGGAPSGHNVPAVVLALIVG